ncbi:MAG: NAD-dependent dehydratase, partial [Bacteroidota bacterium]
GVRTIKADLLDPVQAKAAIDGSSHVYLCVGLLYNIKVWQQDWPRVMQHVIDACAASGARLIFLDNVYMYGPSPLQVPFDETHSQIAVSEKGKIRKALADQLMEAFASGKVKGLTGRAADFYGPGAKNSAFNFSVLERMLKGKAPQFISHRGIPHTYAYAPDLGRALVALALDESTYGQVWHLPVGDPITAEEVAALINAELGTNFKPAFLPGAMVTILSWFIPMLKEASEMLYQFNNEYVMSFEKFHRHFPDFKVTGYPEGIKKMVEFFRAG